MTNQLPSDWGQPTWGAKPPLTPSGRRGQKPTEGSVGTAPTSPAGPQPPGPAGPPPPGSAPARRSRGLLTGIIGVLVAIVAVVVAGFVIVVMWVVSMARGPIEATNSFVADLDEGRLADAYSSMCAETRLAYSLDEFAEHMASAGAITGYTFVSASVRSDDETIVSGTVDLDDVPMAVDFGLREEGGTWKVCSYDTIS